MNPKLDFNTLAYSQNDITDWEKYYQNEHPYAKALRSAPPQQPRQQPQQPRSYQQMYEQQQGQQQQQAGQQNAQQGDGLANKIMVLYVNPNDVASQEAHRIASPYPEILIQDARQVYPRPQWLDGTPTGVAVASRRVYKGERVLVFLKAYVYHLKLQGGAQDSVVLAPSVGYTTGGNFNSVALEGASGSVPVGAVATKADVGEVPQSVEDTSHRYMGQGKVSDADINAYMSRRNESRPPPNVQYTRSEVDPSILLTM